MKRSTSSSACKLSILVLGLVAAEAALCAPPHDPEVVQYVNDALDIMEQRSIYRNTVSWPEFRELLFESTATLTQLSDAHEAIEKALLAIGDKRGHLLSPEDLDPIANDGADSTRLKTWNPIETKLFGQRIGYIRVPNLIGRNSSRVSRYIDDMHDAIESIDSKQVCGWILDLRSTSAGNGPAMAKGIVPILGPGDVVGEKWTDRSVYVHRIEHWRGAYRLKNRNPPVAVLIGPETSGTGEALALAFIGREASFTFGEATAGLATGTVLHRLSDGYQLALSRSLLTDRIGRAHINGIEPQFRARENEIMEAATKWLRSTQPCR